MQAVSIWAASVVVLDLLDMKGNSKELMQSTLTALIGIGEPGCLPAQTFFQRIVRPHLEPCAKLQCVAVSHDQCIEYVFNDLMELVTTFPFCEWVNRKYT